MESPFLAFFFFFLLSLLMIVPVGGGADHDGSTESKGREQVRALWRKKQRRATVVEQKEKGRLVEDGRVGCQEID
jgi:hypothetical protein